MNKKIASIFSKINPYGLLKDNQKKIITTVVISGAISISAQAEERDSGYLNSNNLISSFVSEVSNNVYRELSKEERLAVIEIKHQLNDQLIKNGITQNIHFRTAKYEIDEPVYNYLNNIILSLNNYENLSYELNGYADYRGNSDYNLELSEKRVNSVKEVLLGLGIQYDQIESNYYGDLKSKSQDDSEKYFYDRRVELKVKIEN